MLSTRHVSLIEVGLIGEYLDEAFVLRKYETVESSEWFAEEGTVEEVEGVEWDAMLGHEGEVLVQRVVDEGDGEEAARGGDQRRRRAVGFLRRDKSAMEDAAWRSDVDGWV